jgi:thiosulfate/3-mercaptopyruvate sulfurtransferase
MHTTLISTRELNDCLGSFAIVDCRFDLARPNLGREAYALSHIPGAVYAHLDEDLSSPITPNTGRHPLPNPQKLAVLFGQWGISHDKQVVAYDADNGMFASRLWWLLRWLGHRAVAVLNGGFKAWQAAGLPTTQDIPATSPVKFVGEVYDEMVVSTERVAELVKRDDWRVLDARAPERFRGDVEPIDTVAGHVPGARNHPFAWNMGSDGLLLASDELKRKLLDSLKTVPSDRSVMMCGSGVTACHNLLAMETAGLAGAKLYAGSWSEWIRDPKNPIAKGDR